MKPNTNMAAGGSFLLEESNPADVFTPEEFSDEQKMIREMTQQFVCDEILPKQEALEHQDWNLAVKLLRRCGELGLLGLEVPQKYGGESLDKVSAMIVNQEMARCPSFAVSYGGQSGIGTLPLVYFGSEHLKKKYLPALCKANCISAYALSEATSGSDALAAKTSANPDASGSLWILNGEKMWITNAAFADVFVTFAQANGNQFSCFLVEKGFPGVSTGAEERKMGLKGSSTRTLILQNAEVPAENVLGEIGKGHRVAFNILNIGRAKLAAGAVGMSKAALNDAIQYAKQRVAFGKPIAAFGAIRQKLAEMAIRIWAAEGTVYRTAGLMDRALENANENAPVETMKAIEEYAIECAILKVYGSEILDFVVDEAVQIFGGYGYSAEYSVERYYRDARVYRIFEGTNEINRILIPTMLLKRSAEGRLPFEPAAISAIDAPMVATALPDANGLLRAERTAVHQAKTAFLFTTGIVLTKCGKAIRDQQPLLMRLSDMAMEIYAIDTAVARVSKTPTTEFQLSILSVLVSDAMVRIELSARQVLGAVSNGDVLRHEMSALRRLLQRNFYDGIGARDRIAEELIDQGCYSA